MPSTGSIGRSQAPSKSSVDFTRIRRSFQGAPSGVLGFGVVGHYDQNPAFARVENGKVLVEVTLLPGGEEIVAELGQEGQGGGFAFYIPIQIGARVAVALPDDDDPIIIKRLTDREFPMPDDVAGISAVGSQVTDDGATAAPQFAFIQVPDGRLLAIETGEDGDIAIRSGGNIQLGVDAGQAIHLAGRTRIGAEWATPPEGDFTGASGEIDDGASSTAFTPPDYSESPVSSSPITPSSGLPETGILRIKDPIQSESSIDPAFWSWLSLVHTSMALISTAWAATQPAGGPLAVPGGTPLPFLPATPQPSVIGSRAKDASLHSAEDE